MSRILALDYGLKRTGIAVTDPLQIIASPLQSVPTADLVKFLDEYLRKENVETIIIGEPKDLNNSLNELHKSVLLLKEELEKKFAEKKILLVDERFTSKIAQQTIISSGLKKKARQNKSLVDKVSAAVILQHYLDTEKK